jgi:hypothetical protein
MLDDAGMLVRTYGAEGTRWCRLHARTHPERHQRHALLVRLTQGVPGSEVDMGGHGGAKP